jgi:FAD/FMN-containing dehydrogenase
MSSESPAPVRPVADVLATLEPLEPSRHEVDGLVPEHAVRPSTVAELQEIVRAARAEGTAIVPWGGGTQMGFGNVPRTYQLAVDLTELSDVLRYEPDDMTMSVQAGCRLDELNAMLADHRQVLPLDAARPEAATIGGLTAVGVSGPRRFGYGPLRDLIIGVTVLMSDGSIATAGGQVVKNVTGYDMMRLHHGSLGSMGIVLAVNLKVIPKPQGERTVLAQYSNLQDANDAAISVIESQLGVTACVVLNAPATASAGRQLSGGWTLAVRCEAPPSAVVRQGERVVEYVSKNAESVNVESDSEQSDALWRRICKALDQGPEGTDAGVRVGCTPSRVTGFTARLDDAMQTDNADARLTLDYGSGLVYLRVKPEHVMSVWAALSDAGDHISLLNGPAEMKREIDVFGPTPPGFAMIESMKQTFDPGGILNPGRFIGRL